MPKPRGRTIPLGTKKIPGLVIPRTPIRRIRLFDPSAFLSQAGLGRTIVDLKKGKTIFSQGDPAESIFYIQSGQVKLSVISSNGKEATIAMLGAKDFLGEECVANGCSLRLATAVSLTEGAVLQIDKNEMVRALHEHHALSDIFVSYLLSRNIRVQADLVDQLFNSSEKRLARALLLLAQFGKEGAPDTVIPKISQETLAEMVGTTRSRINFFMNRFRKLGFIEYNGKLTVHSSLLGVVLHD
jgi:CRP/FNR family transcriptional regulator, cyclic AMP receptor protein